MRESVLVVGATSAIGRAIARQLAASGRNVVLAGRRTAELERSARDLEIRYGVSAFVQPFDALDWDSYASFFSACQQACGGELDGVVLCHGDMPEQAEAELDPRLCRRLIDVNYASPVCLLELAARDFEARGRGFLCALSSVAGDRGRPSNHIYGSSKAALSTYLEGLRARMARHGVRVVTVKPGFVDTALTYGRPGLFLVASPDRVAADVLRGIERDRAVVYTPGFWAVILFIIRNIPDPIFKRLSL
jgi:decaprenylphospho-beta-D-erythro-pentofuranosid-2-ulose 2-reductase